MKFQEIKNNLDNRGKEGKTNREKALKEIWQELQYLFQTFEDVERIKNKKTGTESIRQLLDATHNSEEG